MAQFLTEQSQLDDQGITVELPASGRLLKVSVSDLAHFSECRRNFWLNQNWQEVKPASHYYLGTLVHGGLEDYYRHNRNIDEAGKGFIKAREDARQEMDPRFMSSHHYDQLDELDKMAEALLTNYFFYDETEPLEGNVVEVERAFKIPLADEIILSGRIDLIMQTSQGLVIVDHKTASSLPNNLSGLDVDAQMTAYAWAVNELYGELPYAIVYNNIMKTLPEEPKVLKNGTLSKAKGQNTVYELYLGAIEDNGLDPDDYSDILMDLRMASWSKYFRRDWSSRTRASLDSFRKRALIQATEIFNIMENPSTWAYPSPNARTCSFCSFIGICHVMEEQGDHIAALEAGYRPRAY